MRLTVRARMGQTVEHMERAVHVIRDVAITHSTRAVVVSPGRVRIELVMREQLSTVCDAAPPAAAATTRVTLGRREDGSVWTPPLSGRHTLTVGCSGSGK
jgi:S-DNA-T family DNA segregation ATPase FtsK/SpoIIIE